MKKIIIIVAVFLSACSTPPVLIMPTVLPELMVECEKLDTVPENTTQLSVFLETVTANYAKFHECSEKVNAWHLWYKSQQAIVEQTRK
jgi:hypothetical protein